MPKKDILKFGGRFILACGILLLIYSGLLSLLAPVHSLSSHEAQLVAVPDSRGVGDLEYVSGDGFNERKISISAPSAMLYRLNVLPRIFIPARLNLRGGVDVSRDAERARDFKTRFDGLSMKVRLNGVQSYSTSFTPDNLHYRTFSIGLPAKGDVAIEIEIDPGPANNTDLDWAVLKDLRIEPSFTRAFLLAGFLLVLGAVVVRSVRSRDEPSSDSEKDPDLNEPGISSGRKFLYSLLTTVIVCSVIIEASYPALLDSSLSSRFPWIVPPGVNLFEPGEGWVFDPEAGFRASPNFDARYDFKDGDLFEMEKTTLERHRAIPIHLTTDKYGFRNSKEPENARLAVLGDSFTQAHNVNIPFADTMENLLGASVYNLGTPCYGTLQEEISLRRILPRLSGVEVVVLAWFGGNDPWDNHSLLLARDSEDMEDAYKNILGTTIKVSVPDRYYPLERRMSGRILLRLGAAMNTLSDRLDLVVIKPPLSGHSDEEAPGNQDGRGGDDSSAAPFNEATAKELNEFALNLESGRTAIALYPEGGLRIIYESDQKGLEDFEGMQEGLASMGRMREMLAARDVDFLVCYLPGKFAVYRHLLGESYPGDELALRIMSLSQAWNHETPQGLLARLDANMDVQAKLLGDYCGSRNIHFFDLTPGLRAEAPVKLLYYENDTHFNQAGHDFAAGLIADEINRVWPGRFQKPKK